VSRIAVNGVRLNAEMSGEGPALLLLHGFTGSAATWAPFRASWPGFTLVAVDLPGHGGSACAPDRGRYGMESCVEDLLALLDHLRIEKAAVLGYSMGGRVALHLAASAPGAEALILESASPGIEDPQERAERRKSDEALASAIEAGGVEAFVDRWEALPLFASQTRLPPAVREGLRRQQLGNSAAGLASSLRGMGAGAQAPLWDRLPELRVPALLIAGGLDEKYCGLARRMAAALPNARLEVVPEAGHAVHLEQPESFASAATRFLEDCARKQPEEAARCQ
jgi:2-succinyl-6-hydroxy-2,4-cyclohexadiene-1-carboxylate synthase